MGDESPDPTAAFHRTFWPGPKWTGGLPPPSPEEFGPLNWGHHTSPPFPAAPAGLDRTTVTRRVIQGVRFIMNVASCQRIRTLELLITFHLALLDQHPCPTRRSSK